MRCSGTRARSTTGPDLERIADDLAVRFRGVFGRETVYAKVAGELRALARGSHVAPACQPDGGIRRDSARGAEPRRAPPRPASPRSSSSACRTPVDRSSPPAILRQLAGDRVIVSTAGSDPAGEVRHTVVAALDEIGVPLGGEFPKPLTDEAVRAADVVVTMGCGDACPIYPGRRYLDWDLEDPVGKPIERVRAIRDDIEARVRAAAQRTRARRVQKPFPQINRQWSMLSRRESEITMADKPTVLFVCVHNAGRSQMAAGLPPRARRRRRRGALRRLRAEGLDQPGRRRGDGRGGHRHQLATPRRC